MRFGIALKDVSMSQSARLAVAAEAAGAEMLVLPETGHVTGIGIRGRDPFLTAAAALAATRTLRAGTAIAATTIRSARAMGLTAATLADEFPGRFVLGVGVSHRDQVEALGLPFPTSVLSHTRGYLRDVEQVTSSVTDFGGPVPAYLAALGPKMIALAASEAGGLVMNWLDLQGAENTCQQYEAAGGEGETLLLIRVGPRDALVRDATTYRDQLPNYAHHFGARGFRTIDDVVDATCLAPTPGEIAAGLARYSRAGVDVPIVYPTGMSVDEIVDLLDLLGPVVETG